MTDTFLFLQKLLKQTTFISLSRFPYNKALLLDFLRQQTVCIFDNTYLESSALQHHLFRTPAQPDTIYEWVAPGGITFLLHADPSANACYVFGPVLCKPFSGEDTLHQLSQFSRDSRQQADFLEFCQALPVVESRVLYQTADLVVGHLIGRNRPMRILQVDLPLPQTPASHSHFTQGEDIVQMRQVETRYEHSAALTDAVRQGNLSLAMQLIGNYKPGEQTQVRNANPLRNAQNYCIVLNTQLRHALEESGIHPYRVDRLSSEIGMEIEQLKKLSQLPQFFEQVIRRYCHLVQEHTYPNLKPLANLAVTYIKEHLTENITVKDTAKALTVNANYLSSLFHQEMGMTFIDFVNKERTNQAATLLKHTNLQIQQIASSVGYNNTSYFAKQFLRFQGKTPSDFRRGI